MTAALWTAEEIAAATGGTATGQWQVTSLSIDTRKDLTGALFIALVGEHTDGHNFAEAALKAGAHGLLLARDLPLPPDTPRIQVADTMAALEQMALAARARSTATRFAITGSVGKTTSKEMLRQALTALGDTFATTGNYNNHIGVPFTLASLPRTARYAVFELGMNHAHEITPLARLVEPAIALITTIGVAHAANFPDGRAGIARAKAEIFDGTDPAGAAILPADDDFFELLEQAARARGLKNILTFGRATGATARLLEVGHETVTAELSGRPLRFHLPAPGEHMARDALAALLAVEAAGGDVRAAAEALANFTPLKGRGAQRQLPLDNGHLTLIDDCYNANPQSMRAAIQVLGETPGTRRIAVLGDMLELGAGEQAEHTALASALAAATVDRVHCVGPLMRHLWQALPASQRGEWAATAAELAPRLAAEAAPGDIILIKGSRGQQVAIKGVMSPSMAVLIAALEDRAGEAQRHAV